MNTNNTPTPADEPTAAETAAFNSFDPVRDVPSSFEVVGDVRFNAMPTLDTFSPQDRESIMQRAGSNRPDAVNNAIHAHLIEKGREFRIKGGAGAGATQTMRTMLEQSNRVDQLSRERETIQAQLDEVREWRNEFDANGQPKPVPVYTAEGDRRSALQARMDELGHEMVLIAGVQGQRELDEANQADALAAREAKQRVEEFREAERRAEQIAREARINRMTETKAKFRGDTNL